MISDLSILSLDFFILGVLVGIMMVAYCSIIHLLVTWNPYHNPTPPVILSLVVLSIPSAILIIESLSKSELPIFGELLELMFVILGLAIVTLLSFMPFIFLIVTILVLKTTFERESEDPLLALLDE